MVNIIKRYNFLWNKWVKHRISVRKDKNKSIRIRIYPMRYNSSWHRCKWMPRTGKIEKLIICIKRRTSSHYWVVPKMGYQNNKLWSDGKVPHHRINTYGRNYECYSIIPHLLIFINIVFYTSHCSSFLELVAQLFENPLHWSSWFYFHDSVILCIFLDYWYCLFSIRVKTLFYYLNIIIRSSTCLWSFH